MIDDPIAPAVETVADPAPAAATTGLAPCAGDAPFDDDHLPGSPPPWDQRGSPPGSPAPATLADATHSICEADVWYWFG